ncbi:hypothetical protein GJAV_G00108080 [Gymnothorax javanicus]|nr:hypothetical protein GJAV_G00108080 [Gymnothorax javanicus]
MWCYDHLTSTGKRITLQKAQTSRPDSEVILPPARSRTLRFPGARSSTAWRRWTDPGDPAEEPPGSYLRSRCRWSSRSVTPKARTRQRPRLE